MGRGVVTLARQARPNSAVRQRRYVAAVVWWEVVPGWLVMRSVGGAIILVTTIIVALEFRRGVAQSGRAPGSYPGGQWIEATCRNQTHWSVSASRCRRIHGLKGWFSKAPDKRNARPRLKGAIRGINAPAGRSAWVHPFGLSRQNLAAGVPGRAHRVST
jgi:hypothetical protein